MKAFLVLFSLVAITSCTTVGFNARAKLVGDWRYSDEAQSCRYSFKSDGSFSGEVRGREKLVLKFNGRWKVDDGAISYVYLREAFGRIPAGTTDRDQLLEVNKDSFLIQAANGERRRYLRIR